MIKIAHIADCHLRQTQYGNRARGYAFYKGLLSAVMTAVHGEEVDAILCAGDLLDGPYPSAEIITEQLGTIHEFLKEHKVPMLVINGNHDNTRTPWSKVFCPGRPEDQMSGIIPIDGRRYTLHRGSKDQVEILGIPFCQPDELREEFKRFATFNARADIVMWHGEVAEFCGYPREGCICMNDFPQGKFQLIAMGDQHIHRYIKRDSDNLVVAYPGSTELCSSSEDPNKSMYVYTFEEGQLAEIKDVPFKTQPVQRFRILTVEDMEHAYSEMCPGSLVFVDYSPQVKGVMSRLTSFVDTHPTTILRPSIIVEDKVTSVALDNQMEVAEEIPSLQEFVWSTMSDTQRSQRVSSLVRTLIDPASEHREAIDTYCQEALNQTQ